EPVGIHADDHSSLVAAEWRWSRDAWQRGEGRPHPEESEVLNLPHTARLAGEDQLAHGHAAGIEAHDEGRNCPGRHEGARSLDVRDGLRQGLAHVSSRMKVELDEADVLDRFGFDVLDASDVEEVVLII